eukprot:6195410-Pleurochrysis_carterae.AAC.1
MRFVPSRPACNLPRSHPSVQVVVPPFQASKCKPILAAHALTTCQSEFQSLHAGLIFARRCRVSELVGSASSTALRPPLTYPRKVSSSLLFSRVPVQSRLHACYLLRRAGFEHRHGRYQHLERSRSTCLRKGIWPDASIACLDSAMTIFRRLSLMMKLREWTIF